MFYILLINAVLAGRLVRFYVLEHERTPGKDTSRGSLPGPASGEAGDSCGEVAMRRLSYV
jgi:hypothetical protein